MLSGRRADGVNCVRREGSDRLAASRVVVAVLELLLMSELPRLRPFPPEKTSSTLSRLERVRDRPELGELGFRVGKALMPYEEAGGKCTRQLRHARRGEEPLTDARDCCSDPVIFYDVRVAARRVCRVYLESASRRVEESSCGGHERSLLRRCS